MSSTFHNMVAIVSSPAPVGPGPVSAPILGQVCLCHTVLFQISTASTQFTTQSQWEPLQDTQQQPSDVTSGSVCVKLRNTSAAMLTVSVVVCTFTQVEVSSLTIFTHKYAIIFSPVSVARAYWMKKIAKLQVGGKSCYVRIVQLILKFERVNK